ncbi:MAG: Mov34/MPN/PAD-1 family protein [Acidimicrobiia bacterium]
MSDIETLRVFSTRSEADIAVARLAADGIVSAVRVDDEGGLNPGFYRSYGVRVVVASTDLEDAFESLGIERLALPEEVADAMFKHSGWAYPNEACGLVAFDDFGDARGVLCLTNADQSPDRFTIAPTEHHGALRFAESMGWTIGGVFHSHPRSEAIPSPLDIAGGADPDWVHLIVGPVSGPKRLLRAYRIVDGVASEVSVSVVAYTPPDGAI